MKIVGFLIFILYPLFASSQTSKKLERINFFPEAKAYAQIGHQYQNLRIHTPEVAVQTSSVHNHYNAFKLSYAHRYHNVFLGLKGRFELSSENGVAYGVPSRRRFSSSGLSAPELFAIWRIRPQKKDKGLVDLTVSFSPDLGAKEIGGDNANRLEGRRVLQTNLSHGHWEEDWEFKSVFSWTYFGEGEEHNNLTDESHLLEPKHHLGLSFNVQYRLSSWNFIHTFIGVVYREEEDIDSSKGHEREIQSGTGTLFELGLKRPLSEWSLLRLNYQLFRSEYFVKSDEYNLEGKAVRQTITLDLLHAF